MILVYPIVTHLCCLTNFYDPNSKNIATAKKGVQRKSYAPSPLFIFQENMLSLNVNK